MIVDDVAIDDVIHNYTYICISHRYSFGIRTSIVRSREPLDHTDRLLRAAVGSAAGCVRLLGSLHARPLDAESIPPAGWRT